mgnify:CR=1 FL=1
MAETEYAVEVNNEKGFNRQLAVFQTYNEAKDYMNNCNEPLQENEYLNLIFIEYDKHGNEVAFGSMD